MNGKKNDSCAKRSLPGFGMRKRIYLYRLNVTLSDQEEKSQIEHGRQCVEAIASSTRSFLGNSLER